MSSKGILVSLAAALTLGLYLGKTYYPKTETIEVEKAVTRSNVVTVVKEVVKPDGSKETVSTTTDKSVVKHSDSSTTVVAPPRPLYALTASYNVQSDNLSLAPVYGLQLTKQFLGPFSLGLRVQSDKQVGLVVGFEF